MSTFDYQTSVLNILTSSLLEYLGDIYLNNLKMKNININLLKKWEYVGHVF